MKTVALICAAIILGVGCAPQNKRINATGMEMENLRRDIRFLKQQNSQLLRELDSLKKQFGEIDLANRKVRADLSARIDELTDQLESVQGNLKDTNYRMTSFDQRAPRPGVAENEKMNIAENDSLKRLTSPQALAVNQSRALYNTAYRDLSRGNYRLALEGFRQFVKDYPNSDLTDNAQYWTGEVYYAQGRYQLAIEEFERVVKWYGTGDKTASALLKIGFSYLNMEETEQGKLYLEEIVKDYPGSDEASRAQGRLASLN